MKVIFLDVDGVLNTPAAMMLDRVNPWAISSELVENLKRVVENTEAKIVVSSSWRIYRESLDALTGVLREHGMNVLSITGNLDPEPRFKEIQMWLDDNDEVSRFAIFDDDIDAGISFGTSFFHTDPSEGLTAEIASNAIQHLNS